MFGTFVGRDGRRLDHGYRVSFVGARAYTGEATVELWPHGSPPVLAELLEAAIESGAIAAGPGEMTYRALRNGRIDLSRAEAVRDLIDARTRFQARVAFAQAEGAVSKKVAPLAEELAEWIARSEAAVEFVDESETHLASGALRRAIDGIRGVCDELLTGFGTGRVLREGARLVIVGRPNAGKSSLFNRLLARERAIVTDVAGTTRDTLEETLDLEGIPVQLVDTAGLRDVPDPAEREGVRRAEQARQEADLVLLVLDGSREADEQELAAVAEAGGTTVSVATKCDLAEARERPLPDRSVLRVSGLTGKGIDQLRGELRRRLLGGALLEDPIVTDARHARALEEASRALSAAARGGGRRLHRGVGARGSARGDPKAGDDHRGIHDGRSVRSYLLNLLYRKVNPQ